MKSFLEYVADDLLRKYGTNLSRIAVVFPNKRAALFLNDYLAQAAGRPLWSPSYLTISDLFRQHSPRCVADPIKLVCDLHKCFVEATGIDETLDRFYGWGQLLLSDFDDVDKNMAPADKVFANLSDIHEMDDDTYLTPEQREAIHRFFSNFSVENNSELKRRFLSIWRHIGDIYHRFNERLEQQQLAYEGALYRQVAEDEHIHFQYDLYIFVGFNMLQQVEQRLFTRLKSEGKARFYWDFDRYYLSTEAGHFIAQYLDRFPNELDNRSEELYNQFSQPRQLTYISAPTENIQAHYVSDWLQGEGRLAAGRRTAVVLCNEQMLQTVIHCLPPEVDKVNITTGYPLSQSPVSSFVTHLVALRTSGYAVQSGHYRLHYVNKLLRHPYAHFVSPQSQQLCDQLNQQKVYYPDAALLCADDGLTLLFGQGPWQSNAELLAWIGSLLKLLALSDTDDPLYQESVFRMYTLINRLHDLVEAADLVVDIITLQRLIAQLISSSSIPFHGEPAEGLQIMGVLETRNLDFEHVVLLSCNEGNVPKGVNDTSFIPHSLRKAYGLTTIDHKVSIYAYYFHRLLQRAADVTLLYNNATADGQTGEMSRFMLQLMVESPHSIRQQTLQAGQTRYLRIPAAIEKTPAVIEQLRQHFDKACQQPRPRPRPLLTPTAINRYMRCQLSFFYRYACGLTDLDENEEEIIDNRIFGNIFHRAAQLTYKPLTSVSTHISKEGIQRLLHERVGIERAVDQAFKEELFQIRDATRPLPPFDGMQLINREVIIRYVRQLLEIDLRLAPFTILGLEYPVLTDYTVNSGNCSFETAIGGTIDRLDRITLPDGRTCIR
ncbi:MAG: PD-(D/E)XK nuclease family protein, partial [Prevotella sp.]|nr:PD-(D/E)XK nuclease family protein [Prevotella sp.]